MTVCSSLLHTCSLNSANGISVGPSDLSGVVHHQDLSLLVGAADDDVVAGPNEGLTREGVSPQYAELTPVDHGPVHLQGLLDDLH